LHGRRLPLIETAQRPSCLIYPPKHPQIPFQILPDCLDDFRNGLFQSCRLGEDSSHRILRGKTPFSPSAIGDVPDKGAEDVRIPNFCRRHRKLNWKLLPILVLSDNFNAAVQDRSSPCSKKFTEAMFVRLTIPFRNDGLGKRPPQRVLARPSKNRCSLCIPIGHHSGRINRDHPVKRGIDDSPISFLTLEQRGFSGFRPSTFLSRLPMFCAQTSRGPEQQPQHGNPDHPACDPDFP
jgi:hypothetical protein